MIELYHASMSVCSEKVRMALAEKGLEFKSHFMNLREGHQQTPDYIKLNPNAVVPTLVHDGNVIIESAVINEYIAEVFPGTPLTTSSPVSRARMRVWWKQLDESIHAFTGVISFVGLIVPHILRMIGGADNRYLIIASALTGATLLTLADLLARMVVRPAELLFAKMSQRDLMIQRVLLANQPCPNLG